MYSAYIHPAIRHAVTGFVKSGESLETPDSQLELPLRIVAEFVHARIRTLISEVSKEFEIFLTT